MRHVPALARCVRVYAGLFVQHSSLLHIDAQKQAEKMPARRRGEFLRGGGGKAFFSTPPPEMRAAPGYRYSASIFPEIAQSEV